MPPLLSILLVDTNSIYPYPLNRAISKTPERRVKVLRDVELMLVYKHRQGILRIAPYIGQSLILRRPFVRSV
jgi:hypothetical protein